MPPSLTSIQTIPLSLSLSLASVISAVIKNMADDVVLQEAITDETNEEFSQGLKEKKLSWQQLRRHDSLDIESRSLHGPHHDHHSKVCHRHLFPKNLHIIIHIKLFFHDY